MYSHSRIEAPEINLTILFPRGITSSKEKWVGSDEKHLILINNKRKAIWYQKHPSLVVVKDVTFLTISHVRIMMQLKNAGL
jgi:hypothetical protein